MKYLKYLINYILSFFYDIYYYFLGNVRSRIQGINYYKHSKDYPAYLQQGNMTVAVKSLALKYCQGKGLDIGAGKWPLAGARAIEDKSKENAYKILEDNGSQDFVFASHVLEHLKDWKKALQEWKRVLKDGGVLFLYLPHPACKMWEVGVNRQHVWAPDAETLNKVLKEELNMSVVESTSLPDGFLSFIIVAKK